MFGIDVSEFQGIIQWDLVKPQIGFAILRLGWMGVVGSHKVDDQFERNFRECRRLGIPVGVYVYCYSASRKEAKAGAQWTLEVLNGRRLELPVFIDMEEPGLTSLGRNTLTQICIAYGTAIENGNYMAGVYANLNWYTNYLDKARLQRRFITWIASYTSGKNLYRGEFAMWQNSSDGQINGISVRVDTDYLYEDLIGKGPRQPAAMKKMQKDKKAKKKQGPTITYVVQPGDTLTDIAKRYGTTYEELARKNGLENPNLIFVGQELKI